VLTMRGGVKDVETPYNDQRISSKKQDKTRQKGKFETWKGGATAPKMKLRGKKKTRGRSREKGGTEKKGGVGEKKTYYFPKSQQGWLNATGPKSKAKGVKPATPVTKPHLLGNNTG